jgi:hypothetical protein
LNIDGGTTSSHSSSYSLAASFGIRAGEPENVLDVGVFAEPESPSTATFRFVTIREVILGGINADLIFFESCHNFQVLRGSSSNTQQSYVKYFDYTSSFERKIN